MTVHCMIPVLGCNTTCESEAVHPSEWYFGVQAAAGSDTAERKRRTCASPHKVGGQPDGALHRFGELLQNSPIKLRNKGEHGVEYLNDEEPQ